jgi:uncharacterized delta-60 repeat protein
MNFLKTLICKFFLLLTVVSGCLADVIGTQSSTYSLVLQSNARPVVSGYANSCDKDQVMIARYLPDGTLDGTLNGTGYNTTIFGAAAIGKAVTIQPSDQKIVVAGFSDNTIGVLRYTTAGILDTTFGTAGRVNLNLGINEQGNAVAMQSGKILVAGNATVADVSQFFITRLNSNGALDSGFGTAGITLTPIGDGCTANAMGIQSTNKIVLGGTAVVSGQVVFALARYSSSGVLDTTFGTSGTTYVPIGNFAAGTALAIDSSNRILLSGFSIDTSNHTIAVARLTANGTLDGSFGTSGIVTIDIPSTDVDHGLGIAIQADGNIVITGTSGTDIVVIRLSGTDGSLDTTFGGGAGYVLTTVGEEAGGTAVAIQPADQMILVAGFTDISSLILRYDVDGNLDTTFGGSGFGYNINPQGSAEALCGTCTVCPTGATGVGAVGPTGPTGTASLASYAYLYNSALSLGLSVLSTTPVPFNSEGIKVNITHSNVTNNDRFAVVNTGVYKLTAVMNLTTALLGTNFAFYKNGSAVAGTSFGLAGVGCITVQATVSATASDFFQLMQTNLIALTIGGQTSVTIEQIA